MIGARARRSAATTASPSRWRFAVLTPTISPHGPLECVFTADEEVGMIGARALDASDLKAKVPHQHRLGGGGGGGGGRPHGQLRRLPPHGVHACPSPRAF